MTSTDDGSRDDHGHGTNVGAIVAGVAPETKLISLDVLNEDGFIYGDDIQRAVEWAIANKAKYGICALEPQPWWRRICQPLPKL